MGVVDAKARALLNYLRLRHVQKGSAHAHLVVRSHKDSSAERTNKLGGTIRISPIDTIISVDPKIDRSFCTIDFRLLHHPSLCPGGQNRKHKTITEANISRRNTMWKIGVRDLRNRFILCPLINQHALHETLGVNDVVSCSPDVRLDRSAHSFPLVSLTIINGYCFQFRVRKFIGSYCQR